MPHRVIAAPALAALLAAAMSWWSPPTVAATEVGYSSKAFIAWKAAVRSRLVAAVRAQRVHVDTRVVLRFVAHRDG